MDYVISAADLAPIMQTVTSNVAVVLPFGVGLIAVFAGIKLIPKVVKTFTKG